MVGIAMGIVFFCEMIRLGGFTQAFVAFDGDEEIGKHTTFYLSLLLGLIITVLIFFGSSFAESIFKLPQLSAILKVLALTQLFDSLRIVPLAMLLRQEKLKEKALAEGIPFIISAVAAVVIALQLPPDDRIWSLVAMYLIRYVGLSVFSLMYSPYLPRLMFDGSTAKIITKRGMGILFSNIPSSSLENLNVLIIGKRIGEFGTGLFRMAWNINVPTGVIGHAANWTLFRPLAVASKEPEKFNDIFLRAFKALFLLASAFHVWIILIANDLIPLLLGNQWLSAIVPLQWLCGAMLARNLTYISTNAQLAANRSSHAASVWWSTLIIGLLLLAVLPVEINDAVVPSQITFGFYVYACILSLILCSRCFHIRFTEIISSLFPALVTIGLSGGVVFVLLYLDIFEHGFSRLFMLSLIYLLVFLPICGKMMGMGYLSLFRKSGWKDLLKAT